MKSKSQLFKDFPIDGDVFVDGEWLTTPYHVHDGTLLLIGGRIDAQRARDMMAGTRLHPLVDEMGQALAAIWIADFTEANLGPHHELQISVFASPQSQAKASAGRFSIFQALLNQPDTKMVCAALWNNTSRVVQYNSHHLELNAKFTDSVIRLVDDRTTFKFVDQYGSLLVRGSIGRDSRQLAQPMWKMLGEVGFRGVFRALGASYIEVPVVVAPEKDGGISFESRTYSRPTRQKLREFSDDDTLLLEHPDLEGLNFKPDFVQHNEGIGFVFLRPNPFDASNTVGAMP